MPAVAKHVMAIASASDSVTPIAPLTCAIVQGEVANQASILFERFNLRAVVSFSTCDADVRNVDLFPAEWYAGKRGCGVDDRIA